MEIYEAFQFALTSESEKEEPLLSYPQSLDEVLSQHTKKFNTKMELYSSQPQNGPSLQLVDYERRLRTLQFTPAQSANVATNSMSATKGIPGSFLQATHAYPVLLDHTIVWTDPSVVKTRPDQTSLIPRVGCATNYKQLSR